jgi:hypothetical protein
MKLHLFTLALSAGLVSPLMAQDPYDYPADPGYYRETNRPQLNFNPGNMMNLPVNPVRNMFSPSNRYYESYPSGRYAPPFYGYGYPAYPTYPQSYPSYGPTLHSPPGQGYSAPLQPAIPAPAYNRTPAAAMERRPTHPEPDRGTGYRFRPLNEPAIPAPPPMERPQPLSERKSVAGHGEYRPQAPVGYPRVKAPPSTTEAQFENNLRFRPLDKPGYSPDLEE